VIAKVHTAFEKLSKKLSISSFIFTEGFLIATSDKMSGVL
jgi:hypothetical protein